MLLGNSKALDNGLMACVDWLSFTLLDSEDPMNVVSMLGYAKKDFFASSGLNGYRQSLRCYSSPLKILFDGNEGMGVHVDISGSAISDVLSHFQNSRVDATPFGTTAYNTESFDLTVFCDLLRAILENSGQITRLDLAIDDIGTQFFSVSELRSILLSGAFVSKFRKWKDFSKHENGKGIIGETLYLGSRSSDVYLRVYDKQQEQNEKLLSNGSAPLEYTWVRWEFELKRQRAQSAVAHFLDGKDVASLAVGILSNYMRLIESDNTRKGRCTVLDKWQRFIDGIANIRLYVPAPEKTLATTCRWLMKQVAPSIAVVVASSGGALDFIQELASSGFGRLKPHHYAMIRHGMGAPA